MKQTSTDIENAIHLFDTESRSALDLMMYEANDVMERMGVSQELVTYVGKRRGTTRKLYPAAAWLRDPKLRLQLGTASCLHCLGIKILDDIIDADTPYANRELMVGTELCGRAYEMMASHDVLQKFFLDYSDRWMPLWRHVTKEPVTDIVDLAAWERSTNAKAGDIIAFYAHFALAVDGRLDLFENVRPALRGLGVMFTVVNDYTGRDKPTEAHSNLFALMAAGRIDPDDVVELMEEYYRRFEEGIAATPPELNFYQPITETFHRFRTMLAKGQLEETV